LGPATAWATRSSDFPLYSVCVEIFAVRTAEREEENELLIRG